jgi:serine/threonine protein kinase
VPKQRNLEVNSCLSAEITKSKSKGYFINNYIIKRLLGQGSFAKVKLCQDLNSGTFYAMK